MASINNAVLSSKLSIVLDSIAGHPFEALFGTSHRLRDVAPAACDKSSLDLVDLATSQLRSGPAQMFATHSSQWTNIVFEANI